MGLYTCTKCRRRMVAMRTLDGWRCTGRWVSLFTSRQYVVSYVHDASGVEMTEEQYAAMVETVERYASDVDSTDGDTTQEFFPIY